jgi:hypothetical protein
LPSRSGRASFDPFVLFNLGAIAVERREWRKALGFLERSLRGSALTDLIVRKLFALMAGTHHKARRLWADVLAECPADREALAKLRCVPAKPVIVGAG